MAVENTLAYCNTMAITAVKSFVVQAPGVHIIKLFFKNKLDRLSPEKFSKYQQGCTMRCSTLVGFGNFRYRIYNIKCPKTYILLFVGKSSNKFEIFLIVWSLPDNDRLSSKYG
jgi:hypothetical protein